MRSRLRSTLMIHAVTSSPTATTSDGLLMRRPLTICPVGISPSFGAPKDTNAPKSSTRTTLPVILIPRCKSLQSNGGGSIIVRLIKFC